MQKNKIISTYVGILFLIVVMFMGYLLFENNTYRRQISERDALIQRLLIRDSISSKFIKINETDSMFTYIVCKDDMGNTLTYDTLISLYKYYKEEAELKDIIILKAKEQYHFDYRMKRKGDTISVGFWDKKHTKIKDFVELE